MQVVCREQGIVSLAFGEFVRISKSLCGLDKRNDVAADAGFCGANGIQKMDAGFSGCIDACKGKRKRCFAALARAWLLQSGEKYFTDSKNSCGKRRNVSAGAQRIGTVAGNRRLYGGSHFKSCFSPARSDFGRQSCTHFCQIATVGFFTRRRKKGKRFLLG